MHDFEYKAPTSLDSLTSLLAEHGSRARVLAGGTDLIDHIRTGRFAPDVVVDIKRVPELSEIALSDGLLTIGAAVPCCRIYEHPEIGKHFAALVDSASIIGGIQIQNRATLGGNLCTASPAADSIPALIALSAEICVLSGDEVRRVDAADFCSSPGQTVLDVGGVVTAVEIPLPAVRTGSHYRRFIPRNEMDIAVVGVGVSVQLSEDFSAFESVRVALGAVAPTPLLVREISDELAGATIEDGISRAVKIARSAASPIDDMRGTREFRLHVVGVLVERALREAVDRTSC